MPGQALPYQDHARPGLAISGPCQARPGFIRISTQELCWTRTSVKHKFAMYYHDNTRARPGGWRVGQVQPVWDVAQPPVTGLGMMPAMVCWLGDLHMVICATLTPGTVYSTVPLAGISCSAHSTSNVMDSAPISERKVHQLYHLKEPLQSDSLAEAT